VEHLYGFLPGLALARLLLRAQVDYPIRHEKQTVVHAAVLLTALGALIAAVR